MDHKQKVVTRIPPSPTGHLHIGTARTALFNYLYAKQNDGLFLYRSEDTDKERSSLEFEKEIIEGLKWLGISWDNDEIVRQSEQTEVYREQIQQLLDADAAYVSGEPSKSDPSVTANVVRVRNPNTNITFTDMIRGDISFDTTELGDFVIARSIDDPLYHLTVVVDDARMGVTHVLRGEDHISNTPRQIVLQQALGLPRPTYAHLPLILAPDRSKLSKRTGTVAINEYKTMGILAEALVNYIALLGWNPGTEQEVFTMQELIKSFDIRSVQKGGAVFDLEKLKWLNKQHLQKKTTAERSDYVSEAFSTLGHRDTTILQRIAKMADTILERYPARSDIQNAIQAGEYDFLLKTPEPDIEILRWKKDTEPTAWRERLLAVLPLLEQADFSDPETIKVSIWEYVEATGKGDVLWPLRVALTGQERSPDPFTVAHSLGKVEVLERIKKVCAKI